MLRFSISPLLIFFTGLRCLFDEMAELTDGGKRNDSFSSLLTLIFESQKAEKGGNNHKLKAKVEENQCFSLLFIYIMAGLLRGMPDKEPGGMERDSFLSLLSLILLSQDKGIEQQNESENCTNWKLVANMPPVFMTSGVNRGEETNCIKFKEKISVPCAGAESGP